MSRATIGNRIAWLASAALVVAIALGWYVAQHRLDGRDLNQPAPLSPSPYRNTSAEASYVGVAACIDCHPGAHLSYMKTGHSRSLGEVELDDEPPDDQFDDPVARRSYAVYREDGRLWHREWMRAVGVDELELAKYPMRYRIGSGRHSRSYLVDVDGFLFESPVTWYRHRPGWDVSPDYEKNNQGFERPASGACLSCHVGRLEAIEGSLHRVKIHEQVIGCERCHGPGSVHVKYWEDESNDAGPLPSDGGEDQGDLTIVHPDRLAREDNEAICAQCHLGSAVNAEVRGRSAEDFRPGLPMRDFRIDYGLDTPGASMEVVGHIEQLRLSRCYVASKTLTCTTCHQLHDKPDPEERMSFYRDKCLSCHTEQGCGLTETARRQQSADDDCMSCHMPRGPTDLPHFAFTHHRIAVHESVPKHEAPKGIGALVPLDDVSHLSEADRLRSLGIAYLQLAYRELQMWGMRRAEAVEVYFQRAQAILENTSEQGLDDPEAEAALAEFHMEQNRARAVAHADAALRASKKLSPLARVTALRALAIASHGMGKTDRAIEALEQLVQVRRSADDWSLLVTYRQEVGDLEGALEAAQTAAEISPYRSDLQSTIAQLCRRLGRTELAASHERRARLLARPLPPKRKE